MKRLGLILAILIIAVSAWFDWTYHSIRTEVAEIPSRLPSEEALNSMPLEQTVEQLKLAMIECDRVASLQANPIARLLRGDEIKSLADHCELIKGRQDSLEGP